MQVTAAFRIIAKSSGRMVIKLGLVSRPEITNVVLAARLADLEMRVSVKLGDSVPGHAAFTVQSINVLRYDELQYRTALIIFFIRNQFKI